MARGCSVPVDSDSEIEEERAGGGPEQEDRAMDRSCSDDSEI